MSLLDNLYVNLRVISKIPEGGRICTTGAGQVKIEDTKTLGGWLSTGRRRITGDSRDESVKVLMQIVNDVSELSDNIIDSLKTDQTPHNAATPGILNENVKKCYSLQKLSVMLRNSKKGIVNLHATYQDDANITARIDEIMDKIDQQHETITHVLEYMRQKKQVHLEPDPSDMDFVGSKHHNLSSISQRLDPPPPRRNDFHSAAVHPPIQAAEPAIAPPTQNQSYAAIARRARNRGGGAPRSFESDDSDGGELPDLEM